MVYMILYSSLPVEIAWNFGLSTEDAQDKGDRRWPEIENQKDNRPTNQGLRGKWQLKRRAVCMVINKSRDMNTVKYMYIKKV